MFYWLTICVLSPFLLGIKRWFKERRISFQEIDLVKYGISRGELTSVLRNVKLEELVDEKHPDAA
ncbi:MAG: hypothetical protein J6D13_08465, partial [Clostridium sp.]|nr:hypothetical protein [Clostridium sp.]